MNQGIIGVMFNVMVLEDKKQIRIKSYFMILRGVRNNWFFCVYLNWEVRFNYLNIGYRNIKLKLRMKFFFQWLVYIGVESVY